MAAILSIFLSWLYLERSGHNICAVHSNVYFVLVSVSSAHRHLITHLCMYCSLIPKAHIILDIELVFSSDNFDNTYN